MGCTKKVELKPFCFATLNVFLFALKKEDLSCEIVENGLLQIMTFFIDCQQGRF